ncbi:MAG: hypothetical protein AAGG48_23690 [Planctomycetota bacterium]
MSKNVRQSTVLFSIVLTALCVVAVGLHFAAARAETREGLQQDDLVDCRRMAMEINRLRAGKQRALLKTKPAGELNRKISSWAKQSGIPADSLVRIDPRPPNRVGDTVYLEQVTELEILGSQLPKLVELSQIAEQAEDGLKVSSMRLSLPRSDPSEQDVEIWNVELTLTYLIYSPTSKRR